MIVDKKGKIFENRRKEDSPVKKDRRKVTQQETNRKKGNRTSK